MEGVNNFQENNQENIKQGIEKLNNNFSGLEQDIESVGGVEGIKAVLNNPEKVAKLKERLDAIDAEIEEEEFNTRRDVDNLKGHLNPFRTLGDIWTPDSFDSIGEKVWDTLAYITGVESFITSFSAINSKLNIQVMKLDKFLAKKIQ